MASDNETAEDYWRIVSEAQAKEIERLRERCNPSKVVMIGSTGHYVSETVAAEIERLREALRGIAKFGKRNSGCGYSCARMAESALAGAADEVQK